MENEVKEVAEVEEKHSNHHHHSHHHHHHHKSSKKKRFSLRRFAKKHKTALRLTAMAVAMVLVIVATVITVKQLDAGSKGGTPTVNPPTPTTPQIPEGHVALTVTRFDLPVRLHHEAVSTYLTASVSIPAREILGEYKDAGIRLDQGEPMVLSYDVMGLAEGCNITGFRVEVTEKGQKKPVFRKDCGAGEQSIRLYNLKTGATYQYTIRVDFNAMDSITVAGEFETAIGPRLLFVDGVVNVRDFGGWKTADGKVIEQGLLYRGGELDGAFEETFSITDAGLRTMLDEFGIRTEIDLREKRSEADRLGDTVNSPDPYNAPLFDDAFTTSGKKALGEVFKDLANPDNYPIYIHCTYGRDRTGTVCLLLGAFLGMDETDLIREYGLSALYYGGADYANAYKVLDGLKAYEGDSLAQQAENYLRDISLTQEEIDALRQIYLG